MKEIKNEVFFQNIDSLEQQKDPMLIGGKVENETTQKKWWWKSFMQFMSELAVVGVFILLIRSFVILPFQINGMSMYDSYYDKEFIIVDRFSYLTYDRPKRGDVIVFETHIQNKNFFIKRIIGLPWEKVKIQWGKVYIQKVGSNHFEVLDEQYLNEENYNQTYVDFDKKEEAFIFEVPEDSYFVLWDNRKASSDSRTCFSSCLFSWKTPYVHKNDIIGRVFIDLWYFNFKTFSYFQDELQIESKPRFFSSPSTYQYD